MNQFPSQASYITSNLHQLPVDMDTADEVADLLRCEDLKSTNNSSLTIIASSCRAAISIP